MAIKNIGRYEFSQLFPHAAELSPFIGEGVEWFIDDARDVIGIVARNTSRNVWRYAILKRSKLGDFRGSSVSENFFNHQMARVECLLAMEAAEKSEQPAAGGPET